MPTFGTKHSRRSRYICPKWANIWALCRSLTNRPLVACWKCEHGLSHLFHRRVYPRRILPLQRSTSFFLTERHNSLRDTTSHSRFEEHGKR